MDIIIHDHSPQNLEEKYENHFLCQNDDFSIMLEETELVWLQFIPRREISADYAAKLYEAIYQIAETLKSETFGQHYNVAKIGNKLPYYHIHLVFRKTDDECWPNPIWCSAELQKKSTGFDELKQELIQRIQLT